MRLCLVLNRSAGTFRRTPLARISAPVVEVLEEAGHRVELMVIGRHDLADTLSRLAERADLDAVLVGGGDGTLLTAILAGLGSKKPLGVLPVGTLNLLARDLGLPLDPVAAARVLARSVPTAIDLAEVNGHPFAIWASLGMHPAMVRRRDRLQRSGLSKWPAMALALLRAFRRYPMIQAELTLQGKSLSVATPLLVISNNAWRDEPLPLSRQSLDQGKLVVHVARCSTRWGLFWLALNAALGRWRTNRLLATFEADEVRVVSRKRRTMMSLDGEVTVMHSPLMFRMRPKGLVVLMPPRTDAPAP